MTHVEALQWLDCTVTCRLRANCHQSCKLMVTMKNARLLALFCHVAVTCLQTLTHSSICIVILVSVHSSGEENMWEDKLSEYQIRGWRAVFPIGSHGEASHKRSVFSETPVFVHCIDQCWADRHSARDSSRHRN